MTDSAHGAAHAGKSASLLLRLAGRSPSRPWCSRGLVVAVAVLSVTLVAPASTVAQETGYYFRVAPGYSRTTVEHTKEIEVAEISGSSTTMGNAAELSVHLSGGFRFQRGRPWFVNLEVEGIIFAPRTITGEIEPASPLFPPDPEPGIWEYTNKHGLGLNMVLERVLNRSQRLLFFAGVRRMRTEVASGGSERTGVFEQDIETRSRWPFTGGAGAAWGPLNVRVSYFRSLIPWNLLSPEIEVRYSWRTSGVSVNLGVEAF